MKKLVLLALSLCSLFTYAQDWEKEISAIYEASNVPGFAVAIVKNGEVIHAKGYGVKELGKTDVVDANTLFAIASNTKAFISTSIGQLVDEGQLDWKDKVVDYLPYFELYDNYATQEATIEDLLCHRLGLGTFSGDVIWYKSMLTAEETVKRAKYVPQAYGFRDGYGYSNLMFITAGEVIQAVTGMTWHEYAKANFFDPLGMERTITSTQDLLDAGNFATPHKAVRDENIVIDWVNWDNMGAAGGIISSVNDMSQWMIAQLENGTNQNNGILEPRTQSLIWTPQNNFVTNRPTEYAPIDQDYRGYGLGWGIADYQGRKIISHGGGYDGMYSRVMMVPEEGLGVVVLTNGMRGISNYITDFVMKSMMHEGFTRADMPSIENFIKADAMYDRIDGIKAKRVMNTKPSMEAAGYVGTFHTPMYGDIMIKNSSNGLRLEFQHAPLLSASLKHWHFDTFEIEWDVPHAWFDWGTVQFEFDQARNITGISIDVPNNDIFFDELKLEKVERSVGQNR